VRLKISSRPKEDLIGSEIFESRAKNVATFPPSRFHFHAPQSNPKKKKKTHLLPQALAAPDAAVPTVHRAKASPPTPSAARVACRGHTLSGARLCGCLHQIWRRLPHQHVTAARASCVASWARSSQTSIYPEEKAPPPPNWQLHECPMAFSGVNEVGERGARGPAAGVTRWPVRPCHPFEVRTMWVAVSDLSPCFLLRLMYPLLFFYLRLSLSRI